MLPARTPVTVTEATPATAVAVPRPVTVPEPPVLEKVMTGVSLVRTLPAASSIVAVRTRVAPEVRLVVAPLRTIWLAAPGTTLKVRVLLVTADAVASMSMLPASAPVTVTEATPAVAVSEPSPVTVPAPPDLAKSTLVVLSLVSVLPAPSLSVAVRTRVAPESRLVAEPERTTWATEPGTTVKVSVLLSERPLALAVIVTLPASAPVRVLVATPDDAVALPWPVTEPEPKV